ncbi:hypothetical protein DFP72DRAFT_843044 [Ephemerocybe angulata]|uniref:Uncharacterized protein n=1 Tax=Ephemerocybe angulata TaxID=980116 RepID=A0A8H6IBE7_9AGAR|nr:hypothetical protein DFP72DRAFT_843044 [Tulosesus angulatus]
MVVRKTFSWPRPAAGLPHIEVRSPMGPALMAGSCVAWALEKALVKEPSSAARERDPSPYTSDGGNGPVNAVQCWSPETRLSTGATKARRLHPRVEVSGGTVLPGKVYLSKLPGCSHLDGFRTMVIVLQRFLAYIRGYQCAFGSLLPAGLSVNIVSVSFIRGYHVDHGSTRINAMSNIEAAPSHPGTTATREHIPSISISRQVPVECMGTLRKAIPKRRLAMFQTHTVHGTTGITTTSSSSYLEETTPIAGSALQLGTDFCLQKPRKRPQNTFTFPVASFVGVP